MYSVRDSWNPYTRIMRIKERESIFTDPVYLRAIPREENECEEFKTRAHEVVLVL